MPRQCSVCGHDLHHEINCELIKSGASNRRIASQYGLEEISIRRHRAEHLPELLLQASRAIEVSNADDLLRRVEELYSAAVEVLDSAKEDGRPTLVLSAIDRASKQLELLGRLRHEISDAGLHINILQNPQWVEIRTTMIQALEDYPEAARAVSRALLHLDAGKLGTEGTSELVESGFATGPVGSLGPGSSGMEVQRYGG